MKHRKDDAEIARLQRRLREAEAETEAVKEMGAHRQPLIDRLETHLKDNKFAERLVAGLRDTKRRHA